MIWQSQTKYIVLLKTDFMTCKLCNKTAETREGVCWDCAEAESIISDAEDMYSKKVVGYDDSMSTHLNKLRFLIQKGWAVKNK